MPERDDRLDIAAASFAAAVFGSVLAALFVQGWPASLFDWMRVRQTISADPALTPAELALEIGAFIVIVAILLGFVIFGVHAALRRLGIVRFATALAVVLLAAFAIAFAAEAAFQTTRASGYLTAWDATGPLIEDRRLTPHGWETVARRAAAASLFAAIVATAFGLVRSLQALRSTRSEA